MAFLGLFLDDLKPCAFALEVSEWYLTQAGQQCFLTFAVIEKGCELPITHDKVMHVLAARDAPLVGLESSQEGFQLVVRAG